MASFWQLSAGPAALGLAFTAGQWAVQTNFGRKKKFSQNRRKSQPVLGKRPAQMMVEGTVNKKTRRSYKISGGGYNQFDKLRFKSGRKRTLADKRQSILNTIISNYRLRISNINDLSEGRGAYFIGHGQANDEQRDVLPVFMCNLSCVRQGNVEPSPLMRLRMFKTAGAADGAIDYSVVPGLSLDAANTQWQFEDNEGGVTSVGRKSFFDWIRIRLTVWGKQNAPARVKVALVKFSNEEYCPDNYPEGIGFSDNAQSFYQALVKPLVTNPSSSVVSFPKGAMRTIKSWDLDFNPIMTTEADQDPHCKALDIFHRVGKQMDYTLNTAKWQADEIFNQASSYTQNDANGDTASNFGLYPRRIEDSIYLMITSMEQDYYTPANAASRANQVSIDYNIQVSHKTVQPR